MTPEQEEMMYEAIDQAVKKNIQLERERQYNSGKKEGKKEEKKEIAKKLKGEMAPEKIAKITGLTLSAVLKL